MQEKEIYNQRQSILEEIEAVRQREAQIKREGEVINRYYCHLNNRGLLFGLTAIQGESRCVSLLSYEPPHGKTYNLHRRKQRHISASQ